LNFKFTNTFGVGLAFGSIFIWALYWILNLKDNREEVSKLFLNFVFGFLYIVISLLVIKLILFVKIVIVITSNKQRSLSMSSVNPLDIKKL